MFKVTKDAEIDIDNDVSTSIIQKIEKGVKNRRKGKPVRFVFDKQMDEGLLDYLVRKLNLSRNESLIPGGRIHNFRHFMDFPNVFQRKTKDQKAASEAKNWTKVIRSIRSPKTGAYTFKESIVHKDKIKEFLAKK